MNVSQTVYLEAKKREDSKQNTSPETQLQAAWICCHSPQETGQMQRSPSAASRKPQHKTLVSKQELSGGSRYIGLKENRWQSRGRRRAQPVSSSLWKGGCDPTSETLQGTVACRGGSRREGYWQVPWQGVPFHSMERHTVLLERKGCTNTKEALLRCFPFCP